LGSEAADIFYCQNAKSQGAKASTAITTLAVAAVLGLASWALQQQIDFVFIAQIP